MAKKMNTYKKYVITGAGEKPALAWNNAEAVLTHGDDDIIGFVEELRAAAEAARATQKDRSWWNVARDARRSNP